MTRPDEPFHPTDPFRSTGPLRLSGMVRTLAISLLFIVPLVLSGCQSEPTMSEPKVLKVFGNSYEFTTNGALFSVVRDDVELELIDMWEALEEPLKELQQELMAEMGDDLNAVPSKEMIERYENKLSQVYQDMLTGPDAPDVVMLDFETFSRMAKAGLFAPLDPYIEKTKFDTSHLVQPILEALRDDGDGTLYGLTPSFYSEAIIYDRHRFDELGLPYPQGGMSWDELLDLARSLSGEKNGRPYYGFSFGTSYTSVDVVEMVLHGKQEHISKDETLQTDARKKWWGAFQTLIQQKVIAPPLMDRRYGLTVDDGGDTPGSRAGNQGVVIHESRVMTSDDDTSTPVQEFSYDPIADDPFLSGRSAMQLVRSFDISWLMNMENEARYRMDGAPDLDWDFTPLPSPVNGGKNAILNVGTVYAINASATERDLAWAFIDFVHGERAAQANAAADRQFVNEFLLYAEENRLPGFEDKHLAAFWPDGAAVFRWGADGTDDWEILEEMKKAFVKMVNSGQDPGEILQTLDERLKKQ